MHLNGQLTNKSFETFKTALTIAPTLAFPDMSKSFYLSTDASGHAIVQKDNENKERVISYRG